MHKLIDYGRGIYAIDADYLRPQMAAIHLVVEDGRAALVDSGCNHSLSNVLMALEQVSVPVSHVDYVILTHVHLDHAGGAGAMMRAFPNAQLVVHPRGARHMIDPSKLIEGASAVYGADEVRRMYGDILPVEAARVIEATHGLTVNLAGRNLLCLDTPGHARHHIGIVDEKTGHIFTGDVFGVSLREIDSEDGRQFVFPTTTPVQFDPVATHASIDLLMSYRPEAAYLTHFGQITDLEAKAAELHRLVDAQVEIALHAQDAGEARFAVIKDAVARLLLAEVRAFGCALPDAQILALFRTDIELNTQGLCVWLDSRK